MIGAALADHFTRLGWRVQVTTRRRDYVDPSHFYLNLADPETELPPADFVILAAAAARIGDCETDPVATRRINVDGALAVARQMAGQGSHVLFLSSDKVFDGTLPQRNRHDALSPACAYGRQKADAEAGILALGEQGAILRLSKVLTPEQALLTGWAEKLAAGEPIAPFHDLYLAPVPVDLAAVVAAHIGEERAAGIYHCTGAEDRTYVDLARILAESMDRSSTLVQATSCQSVNMAAAARPRHTTLEMAVERTRWGLTAPTFEATARRIIASLR